MSEKNPIQISTYGISDQESVALTTTIKLLQHDGIYAQIKNDKLANAHLLVVDMDTAQGKEALCASRVGQVKLVLSSKERKGKNIISLLKPIDITSLKNVLNKVLAKMQQQLSLIQKNESKQIPDNNQHSDVITNTVFHLLLSTKENQTQVSIASEAYPDVLIDGKEKSVSTIASGEDLTRIIETPLDKQEVKKVNGGNKYADNDDVQISSLYNVLWSSAISCSKGRLLPGHDVEEKVKLKAWPNFTRNDFRPSHLKLAAILAQKSVSLSELESLTGVSQDDIVGFYNAAYAVDLIDKSLSESVADATPRQVSKEKKTLFSKIASRLGFGHQDFNAAGA